MFQGASSLSLDAKGRLSVPTRHRDALGSPITLTRHPDGCLLVFAQAEWERFRGRVAALPVTAQWWKRILLGNAMGVAPDATGRILISPELRAAAGLERDATLLGMGTHLELWDRATHAAKEAEALKAPMPDVFKDFSF